VEFRIDRGLRGVLRTSMLRRVRARGKRGADQRAILAADISTNIRRPEMGRTIGAVVAGVVLWGVLWNALNFGLRSLGRVTEPITGVGLLLGLIAYSAALSVGAGWVAAAIKGDADAMTAVKALAGTNLLIGIVTEVLYWELMPVWYHVVFLALVVPMTLQGGRLKAND
jgi:hypothetical protein